MILLNLGGGLGNQMFRYAAAWSLQKRTGEKLFISFKGFEADVREFSLDNFNIPQIKRCPKIIEWYVKTYMKAKYKFHKFDESKLEDCENLFKIGYCKTRLRQYIKIDESPKIKYLDSGFQSIRYFKEDSSEIKQMFRVKIKLSELNMKMLERIKNTKNSVCLHIRLGDYQEERYKRFNVCTPTYYLNAISKMETLLENPIFYIFTENFEIVKSWNLPQNVVFVDLQNKNFEDLQLMYNCDNFIISNSTYSWWAQFLSNNDKKIVIAPERWFNGEENNPTALYCENWILMKVD